MHKHDWTRIGQATFSRIATPVQSPGLMGDLAAGWFSWNFMDGWFRGSSILRTPWFPIFFDVLFSRMLGTFGSRQPQGWLKRKRCEIVSTSYFLRKATYFWNFLNAQVGPQAPTLRSESLVSNMWNLPPLKNQTTAVIKHGAPFFRVLDFSLFFFLRFSDSGRCCGSTFGPSNHSTEPLSTWDSQPSNDLMSYIDIYSIFLISHWWIFHDSAMFPPSRSHIFQTCVLLVKVILPIVDGQDSPFTKPNFVGRGQLWAAWLPMNVQLSNYWQLVTAITYCEWISPSCEPHWLHYFQPPVPVSSSFSHDIPRTFPCCIMRMMARYSEEYPGNSLGITQ